MSLRGAAASDHAEAAPASGVALARAESIGIEAWRILTVLGKSRVVAVFRRSLYLRSRDDAWACVGDSTIGRAPLNIPCETQGFTEWCSVVAIGDVPVADASGFVVGNLKLTAGGAATWRNRSLPSICGGGLACGLRCLAASLPSELPREGLAPLLWVGGSAASAAIAKAALLPVTDLCHWASAASRARSIPPVPQEALHRLIGLGVGLTPSGDDFLAGFVVALRAVGWTVGAEQLARDIMAIAPAATSDISAAHLRAALRSGLKEDLHELLDALLQGDPESISAGIKRLQSQPHYSSWDTLAGVTTALQCFLATAEANCSSSALPLESADHTGRVAAHSPG